VVATIAEDDPKLKLYTAAKDLEPKLQFGKSINGSALFNHTNPSVLNIHQYCETMPQPKGKKKKKKKAEEEPKAEGEEASTSPKKKGKKKKKEKKSDLPPPCEWIR
jgi:hypothetical protein